MQVERGGSARASCRPAAARRRPPAWDRQSLEPRRQRESVLAAADDQAIGLLVDAKLALGALAPVDPGLAAALGAVRDAGFATRAGGLLEADELERARQRQPCAIAFERDDPAAADGLGLESEPRVVLGQGQGFGAGSQVAGAHPRRLLREHRSDRPDAFARGDGPGQRRRNRASRRRR